MTTYLTRLVQQTGLTVIDQGGRKPSQGERSDYHEIDAPSRLHPAESFEVDEIIEVSVPQSQKNPDHDENPGVQDRKEVNIGEKSATTNREGAGEPVNKLFRSTSERSPDLSRPQVDNMMESSSGILNASRKKPPNQPEKAGLTPDKPVPVPEPENKVSDRESEDKSQTGKESAPLSMGLQIEASSVSEQAPCAPVPSIEQHVYLSRLPEPYKKVIREWLTTPADGVKRKQGSLEQLHKNISGKQHSKVILKPESGKDLPVVQNGVEQVRPGELHLTVGAINLTVQVPDQPTRSVPPVNKNVVQKQENGSSRLSRHYVNIR